MAASGTRDASSHESRTIIWGVPRTVSTALLKCLSFIEDIQVWFEPYTYCRAAQVHAKQLMGVDLPNEYEGNEEVYRRVADYLRERRLGNTTKPENISYAFIGRQLEASTSRHVLVKDFALTVNQDQRQFIPKGFKHIFLIRHPLRVFASTRKSIFNQLVASGLLTGEAAVEENFNLDRDYKYPNDPTGAMIFKDLYDMWKYVQCELGQETVVFDSDDLLSNPSEMLPKICEAAGLPYDESLLKWDASSEVTKTWVVYADDIVDMFVHFYDTAIKSSEFLDPGRMPSRDEVRPDVIRCTEKAMRYFEEMYEKRVKI
ncbi:uncharacterized protein LOC121426603 [Lytechinus variegatus]|uniref:uncharacterized protein LOC121426603 n=1 Tax=Lytechinus variegatus TaxID=7654 RepID=UPI001BB1B6BA|nr:uncharacterized protein LOC121426603 [Lytechinus variegatus]